MCVDHRYLCKTVANGNIHRVVVLFLVSYLASHSALCIPANDWGADDGVQKKKRKKKKEKRKKEKIKGSTLCYIPRVHVCMVCRTLKTEPGERATALVR